MLPQGSEYRGLYAIQIVILWNSNFPHYGTELVQYVSGNYHYSTYTVRYGAVAILAASSVLAIVSIMQYTFVFRILFLYFAYYSCIFRIILSCLADYQYCHVLRHVLRISQGQNCFELDFINNNLLDYQVILW